MVQGVAGAAPVFHPQMVNIYFVRHANQRLTKNDPPLTKLGQKNALKTGKFFLDKNIDLILSSPQKRALETAEIIKSVLINPPLMINPLLKERINFGDVKGQTYKEFIEMWKKSTADRDFVLPNGESSRTTGDRMVSVVQILVKGKYKNIVVATHGGAIIDFIRNVFTDDEINNFVEKEKVYFKNLVAFASITQILVDETVKLVRLNYFDHLT